MTKLNKFFIALAFAALGAGVLNAQTSGSCGANGNNLTWQLTGTGTNRTLTISGTGAMANYYYDNTNGSTAPWASQSANIKTLVLPSGMTTIGNYAFYGCNGLTSVTIPNSVTIIGYNAFDYCSGLTGALTIPNSVTSIGVEAFRYCSGLTGALTIPNSVTTIGGSAFRYCSGLTGALTIPNSVTTIGGYAFSGCSGLTSIDVGESNTQYSSIDGVLFNKNQTTLIQYPAGKQGSSYIIPNSVTTIENAAFYECSGLTSVTIPNSVTSIGNGAFADCSGLTGNLTIPNGVTTIGNNTFSGCSGLTSVTIPNSVTSIGNYAFRNCSGLTSVTIPNSVTSIGYNAFEGCSGLTSVTIPNSVTFIGYYAFRDCSGLTSVTIPNSVTSIGAPTFWNCYGLTSITVSWVTPPNWINSNVFGNLTLSNINLHVPCGSSDLYAAAPVWEDFNINEALAITAIAGSNGTISDEGITIVNCGEDKTYTFAVTNTNYEIDEVLIDYVPNATAKENGYHTFENIITNHTIQVTFKAIENGIADIPTNSISIYPNPTQNELTIDGGDLQINRVEICDLAGRAVFGQPQGSPLQINVSALPAGIYLVRIHTEKGIVTRKVVKN